MINQNKTDLGDFLSIAREKFEKKEYKEAEIYLHQLILKNNKNADIFYMLGSIFHDQGKFNRAINAFQRALQIKPDHTDSAISLSIIYNDLGLYDEGKKIFNQTKKKVKASTPLGDPHINEKIALKHSELGDVYYRFNRFEEALIEYDKAISLNNLRLETIVKRSKVLMKTGASDEAIQSLIQLKKNHPEYVPSQINLGLYYTQGKVAEAILQWEHVISMQPTNDRAKMYLDMA